MKPAKKLSIGLIIIGSSVILLVLVLVRTKLILRIWDDLVLDSKQHYLPCDKLPSMAKAWQVVEEHQDVMQKIEQVHPGLIGVGVDEICPGKADIVIWYGSHLDRVKIEKIINNETFFGIPYRLQNR